MLITDHKYAEPAGEGITEGIEERNFMKKI